MLGTHLHWWGIFQFTHINSSSPTPFPLYLTQTTLDECIQNFSEFQYCIDWGAGELQENFEKDARFYKATRNYRKL